MDNDNTIRTKITIRAIPKTSLETPTPIQPIEVCSAEMERLKRVAFEKFISRYSIVPPRDE